MRVGPAVFLALASLPTLTSAAFTVRVQLNAVRYSVPGPPAWHGRQATITFKKSTIDDDTFMKNVVHGKSFKVPINPKKQVIYAGARFRLAAFKHVRDALRMAEATYVRDRSLTSGSPLLIDLAEDTDDDDDDEDEDDDDVIEQGHQEHDLYRQTTASFATTEGAAQASHTAQYPPQPHGMLHGQPGWLPYGGFMQGGPSGGGYGFGPPGFPPHGQSHFNPFFPMGMGAGMPNGAGGGMGFPPSFTFPSDAGNNVLPAGNPMPTRPGKGKGKKTPPRLDSQPSQPSPHHFSSINSGEEFTVSEADKTGKKEKPGGIVLTVRVKFPTKYGRLCSRTLHTLRDRLSHHPKYSRDPNRLPPPGAGIRLLNRRGAELANGNPNEYVDPPHHLAITRWQLVLPASDSEDEPPADGAHGGACSDDDFQQPQQSQQQRPQQPPPPQQQGVVRPVPRISARERAERVAWRRRGAAAAACPPPIER